jgi:hypothetical protein
MGKNSQRIGCSGAKKKGGSKFGSALGGVVKGSKSSSKMLARGGCISTVNARAGPSHKTPKNKSVQKKADKSGTSVVIDREYEVVRARAAAATASARRQQEQRHQRPVPIVFAPATFVMPNALPQGPHVRPASAAINAMLAEVSCDGATLPLQISQTDHQNDPQQHQELVCAAAGPGINENRFNAFSGDDDEDMPPPAIQFATASFQLPATFSAAPGSSSAATPESHAAFHAQFGVGLTAPSTAEANDSRVASSGSPLTPAAVLTGPSQVAARSLPDSDDEL